MNESIKYDPEDLESLLSNKTFEELYPEEKNFVLKHLDSAEEYASLRDTLLSVLESKDTYQDLTPRLETQERLLQEFDTEEKAGFKIWLNSLFASWNMSEGSWYQSQGLQLGFATVLVLVVAGFFYFNGGVEQELLADNISHKENKELELDRVVVEVDTPDHSISKSIEEESSSEHNVSLDMDKDLNQKGYEVSESVVMMADEMMADESNFAPTAENEMILDDVEMDFTMDVAPEMDAIALSTSPQTFTATAPITIDNEDVKVASSTQYYTGTITDTNVLKVTENLSQEDFAMGNAMVQEELVSVTLSEISETERKKKNNKDLVASKANLNDYSTLLDLLYTAP